MPRKLTTPPALICWIMGATFSANRWAPSDGARGPDCSCFGQIGSIGQQSPLPVPHRERGSGAFANRASLLLGERGIDMEHKRVHVGAEFDHQERYPLCHQAGDAVW